ncbi:MAG: peptidase MA family metallohydrolase [Anaerolineales bacterium]|jgi:hypothetical protein
MRPLILISLLTTLLIAGVPLQGSAPVDILANQADLEFPDQITFSLQARGDSQIESIELEYGVDAAACNTDLNRTEPQDFTPGQEIDVEWTWDMRQTGSLPPGARLWWRWRMVDAAGQETVTETRWITWLDDVHPWQIMQGQGIIMHYYQGSESFARTLYNAAQNALYRLRLDVGAIPNEVIHFYIYASTEDLHDAILFEPDWTGGQAYANYQIVIIGIPEEQLSWGETAVAHEMAHIVIGSQVNNCYSRMPSWLSEGLAVYAEGGLSGDEAALLQQSINDDTLFEVRSLNDSFSNDRQRAGLAYAQSYSLVDFLVQTYGRAQMNALLAEFQAGYRADSALQNIFGFNTDGLEIAWREYVGAQAHTYLSDQETTQPTPYPTFVPYANAPVGATEAAEPVTEAAPETDSNSSSPAQIAMLVGGGIGIAVLFAGLGIALRRISAGAREDDHFNVR